MTEIVQKAKSGSSKRRKNTKKEEEIMTCNEEEKNLKNAKLHNIFKGIDKLSFFDVQTNPT